MTSLKLAIFVFGSASVIFFFSLIYIYYWNEKFPKVQNILTRFKVNQVTLANFLSVLGITLLLITMHGDKISTNEQNKKWAEQTKLLKNQIFMSNSLSISQIGDRCMWDTPHGGDYDSYLLLNQMAADPINEKMINAIRNQIDRVEKKYSPVDMLNVFASHLKAIWKEGADPKKGNVWADIETVTLNKILLDLKNRYLETENIKTAYFMSGVTPQKVKDSGKTWNDVFDALIWAINNESWCLWGRKMALISYCQLAEKQFPDNVFAFKEAAADWKKRKNEILKKKNKLLTNQSSCPMKTESLGFDISCILYL